MAMAMSKADHRVVLMPRVTCCSTPDRGRCASSSRFGCAVMQHFSFFPYLFLRSFTHARTDANSK